MYPEAEGMLRDLGWGLGVLHVGRGERRMEGAFQARAFWSVQVFSWGLQPVALLYWREGGICSEAWPKIGAEGDWNMQGFEPLNHSCA